MDGTGPRIDVFQVPERKTVKNRLHLELRADGSSTADELARLLALGTTRADVGQGSDVTWTVLADPEGNEFCLLSRPVQEFPGRVAHRRTAVEVIGDEHAAGEGILE